MKKITLGGYNMKTAAVFFADGFEEIEALSPVDYLRRADVEVITVAVPSPTMNDKYIVTSSHKVPIIADLTLDEYLIEFKDNVPDAVICPGGSTGAINLSNCKDLLEHLEKVWDSGKLVAAICASPAVVLGKTKIPFEKNWTCYPGMESESNPSYINRYQNKVFITDGNLITGRGPGASEEFAMELVRILTSKETAERIRTGSQQR